MVKGPNYLQEITRTLAYAAALRGELDSEEAADQLIELLRAEPLAKAAVEQDLLKDESLDEMRAFIAQEDRELPLRAPMQGVRSEGLTIKDLLEVRERSLR